MKKILNQEHAAFQGVSHWLIAILFFFLMWLIPNSFSSGYINAISSNTIFAFIIFFTIGGAALLPDLDSVDLQGNGGSTAIYQLGFLGNVLSILCMTVSGVVYTIVHTKYDDKPKSQHRMLFHAPIIPILLFIYVWYGIPESGQLKNNMSGFKDGFGPFMTSVMDNIGILFVIFLAGISIYLGANMLIYKMLKLIRKQYITSKICMVIMILSIIYMFNMSYYNLKLIGIGVSLGYLFHIIADVATKGSAPLFFPIPTPNKNFKFRFWWKPYLLGPTLTITTGGIVNIILNFVLFGVNIFLAWFIFLK